MPNPLGGERSACQWVGEDAPQALNISRHRRCQSRQRVGLNDMAFPVDRKDTTMSTSTSPRLIRPRKNRFKTRVTWHSPTPTHRAGIPTALPRGHTRVPKALESTAHQNRVPKKKLESDPTDYVESDNVSSRGIRGFPSRISTIASRTDHCDM